MSKSDTLAAFLGGAALGAVIALLFAPSKGEDTRAKIADTLREHGVNLDKENLNKLIDALQSKFSTKAATDEPAEEA